MTESEVALAIDWAAAEGWNPDGTMRSAFVPRIRRLPRRPA
jgi:hypothetical protein